MFKILDSNTHKLCRSPNYNYSFRKKDGFFVEWGETLEDNPDYAPTPNIADIEVSKTITNTEANHYRNSEDYIVTENVCSGKGCGSFCYKKNKDGHVTLHRSKRGFAKLLDKLPNSICQIALGTTDVNDHPEIWDIFAEIKNRGMVGNVTVNGGNVNDDTVLKLSENCGAVAVSVNEINKDMAYDAVEKIIRAGIKQTNIHFMLSHETLPQCYKIMNDCVEDVRLKELNAIVLLMFKNKTTNNFTSISDVETFRALVNYAKSKNIPLGFDSCSAHLYNKVIQDDENFKMQTMYVTECCAARFSMYVDIFGNYYPCSFLENSEQDGWTNGINVLENDDFITNVWNHDDTIKFRNRNIQCVTEKVNPCSFFNKGN